MQYVSIVARLWAISKRRAFLIIPVVLWVTFATAIVLSGLGWL
ncbi:MAG: tryptophan-rich sensory protein [Brasilonema angustatum HA4187-MV1]|nr:tryptophan-rich sensory protein [Brasilonema angustatum HA4187-MV1]